MGTRSRIGIMEPDGRIVSIYCHWDGYVSHNGVILFKHYNSPLLLKEMLLHGDMSSMGMTVGTAHDFDKRPDGSQCCTYYYRDRHESWDDVQPRLSNNLSEFMKLSEEYNYLFIGDTWFVYGWSEVDNSTCWKTLELAILEEFEKAEDKKFRYGLTRQDLTNIRLSKKFEVSMQEKVDFLKKPGYNTENGGEKTVKTETKEFNMTKNVISRMKLEGFLLSQAGRFIGLKSKLKSGTDANWNGRVVKDSPSARLDNSYITFQDNNKARKDKMGNKGGFRTVDLATVSEVSVNGVTYTVAG